MRFLVRTQLIGEWVLPVEADDSMQAQAQAEERLKGAGARVGCTIVPRERFISIVMEACEHDQALTAYCQPCGRIHGGG